MRQPAPVTENELHAYVDGELDAQRRVEIEAWLATHPGDAQRVKDYQAIRTRLHQRFDDVLTEPVGAPDFGNGYARYSGLARAAAVGGLMLGSGLLGWSLDGTDTRQTDTVTQLDLVHPAAFAHEIYSADTRYPVEIPALQQASLDRWISRRMHTDLSAPDLEEEGLTFIGGRLLPSTNRMAAQFMYEDEQGARITVYVRRIGYSGEGEEFQYAEKDGLHVFYWLSNTMGYAVIGEQPAAQLIAIASAVQSTFNKGSAKP